MHDTRYRLTAYDYASLAWSAFESGYLSTACNFSRTAIQHGARAESFRKIEDAWDRYTTGTSTRAETGR